MPHTVAFLPCITQLLSYHASPSCLPTMPHPVACLPCLTQLPTMPHPVACLPCLTQLLSLFCLPPPSMHTATPPSPPTQHTSIPAQEWHSPSPTDKTMPLPAQEWHSLSPTDKTVTARTGVALAPRPEPAFDSIMLHNPDAKRAPDGTYLIFYDGSSNGNDIHLNQRIGAVTSASLSPPTLSASIYLSTCLPLPVCVCVCVSLCRCPSTCLPLPVCVCVCVSLCRCPSTCLPLSGYVYLSCSPLPHLHSSHYHALSS
jgi:hypothetical protein